MINHSLDMSAGLQYQSNKSCLGLKARMSEMEAQDQRSGLEQVVGGTTMAPSSKEGNKEVGVQGEQDAFCSMEHVEGPSGEEV